MVCGSAGLPKLKAGAAGAGAVVVSSEGAGAPNKGLDGADVAPLPKILVLIPAGLAPKRELEAEASSFFSLAAGAPNRGFCGSGAGFSGSAGFWPNKVDDFITEDGALELVSAGFAAPNRAGVSAGFDAPNRVDDSLGFGPPKRLPAVGLAGSVSLGLSAGFGAKSEPPKAGGCCLGSGRAFCWLGPVESFSLSDSPSSSTSAAALVSFSAGLSSFGAPNIFEGVAAPFGAKALGELVPALPNSPVLVDDGGANLRGVVLGFQV